MSIAFRLSQETIEQCSARAYTNSMQQKYLLCFPSAAPKIEPNIENFAFVCTCI